MYKNRLQMASSRSHSLSFDKYSFHPYNMPGSFKQTGDAGEGDDLTCRKSILGRGDGPCTGPGVGVCLVCA